MERLQLEYVYNPIQTRSFEFIIEFIPHSVAMDDLMEAAARGVVSAQDLARSRPPPPLPAPSVAPDPELEESAEDVQDDAVPAPPQSKNIFVFKQHVRVNVLGESRKFEQKFWGATVEGVSTMAAEIFEQEALATLAVLDSLKGKPKERITFLLESDVDSKFAAKGKSLVAQKEALVRQLCRGKVRKVEKAVIEKLIKRMAGPKDDINQWSINPTLFGFTVSFAGGKELLEKSFARFNEAIRWLKSLSIANKDILWSAL